MKTLTRSIIASVFAFGLLTVGLQANANPGDQNNDPLLVEIMTDYDS